MRRKRILIGIVCLVFGLVILWGYGRLEVYCFFYPSIDTKSAPRFSEKAFNQISNVMAISQVNSTLGKPLLIFTNSAGLEKWSFTDDGKCWWGDFAWLWRSINISNNTVVSVHRSIRYD
jgi:hypothetical protein